MTHSDADERLETLLGFLEQDRANLLLATDAAEAALAADRLALAGEILAPFDEANTLDARSRHVAGLAAMRLGDQPAAQRHFELLLEEFPDDGAIRFNLAWSHALANEYERARAVLGDDSQAGLPQAAMLDLQLHHHLGELEAAEDKLANYLERFPDYAPLQAAASVLAMDLDQADLARACAERGGAHPDALSTLGALELGEQRIVVPIIETVDLLGTLRADMHQIAPRSASQHQDLAGRRDANSFFDIQHARGCRRARPDKPFGKAAEVDLRAVPGAEPQDGPDRNGHAE